MNICAFHHPGFAVDLGAHIMPMRKFALVAERALRMRGVELRQPTPVDVERVLAVHERAYVDAVRTGEPRWLAESQKFPWSSGLFASVLLTGGAVLSAARVALRDGVASALASGFHHAHRSRGEGFCTFNGLVVALQTLVDTGVIQHPAVLDMDLHYGNGTALLAGDRPWLRALSIYGNDYADNTPYRDVTVLRHRDADNHRSAALPAGCDGVEQRRIMDQHLPWLLVGPKPDLLLYQAGADPLRDDPYSPLNLTHQDLLDRDRAVFAFARDNAIPVAWVLAGGYTPDIQMIVTVHENTLRAAVEVFGA